MSDLSPNSYSLLGGATGNSILVLLLLVGGCVYEAAASDCPTPTSPPSDLMLSDGLMQPRTLEPYSISQTVEHYYDAPLGLGFFEIIEKENNHYYDWMFELVLPLWQAPDATRPLGWLIGGKVYADAGVSSLTGVGMVETDYEHTSFIVWETQNEWFNIRLANGLYAWTHRCHLSTKKFRLDFVPWQTFFHRHADWLHFRRPVTHMLRASPSMESERVTTIGLDHKLILLDVQGDWMKVEIEQPDITCRGPAPDDAQPVRNRGWVKWRDDAGPWLYIYTRGC